MFSSFYRTIAIVLEIFSTFQLIFLTFQGVCLHISCLSNRMEWCVYWFNMINWSHDRIYLFNDMCRGDEILLNGRRSFANQTTTFGNLFSQLPMVWCLVRVDIVSPKLTNRVLIYVLFWRRGQNIYLLDWTSICWSQCLNIKSSDKWFWEVFYFLVGKVGGQPDYTKMNKMYFSFNLNILW